MEFLYKFIYNTQVNYFLRNYSYAIKWCLPKKFRIPPSGILQLQTDSGTIKLSTNQTSYLTQLLFWNGYKNFEYSEIFEQLSKKVSSFMDIGSNIGYYSLIAAKSNPNIMVYAFEPASGPKFFLQRNIQLNHFEKQITFVDLALSDTIGQIDFYEVKSLKYKYLEHNLAGEGNAGTKKTTRNFIKNTVNSTTLTDFIKNKNIKEMDLIKIDTEGTEIIILNSGKEFITKFQPIVICETLFNIIENELEDFFKDLNYDFYNHTEKGLKKVNTIKRYQDNSVRNCFFVPKNKISLISEYIQN